jgi:hypothetical protein
MATFFECHQGTNRMDAAKVQLSKEELALVSDPGWILTKNSIMGRAVALFAELAEKQKAASGELRAVSGELRAMSEGLVRWPANWDTPKISKGENYLGLPYVMLDYPRLFTREHVLAIRTMFWWGHYFSVTLHLKGRMQEMFLPVIQRHTQELADAGFHIAISEDEWRHEVAGDNYRPLSEAVSDELRAVSEGHPFLKLAATCGLDKWNKAPEILMGLHKVLISALSA